MEIKTKFDYADKVWFMFDNEPTTGTVEDIFFRPIEKDMDFCNEHFRIKYLISHADMFGTDLQTEVGEADIFKDADTLIKSLTDKIKLKA